MKKLRLVLPALLLFTCLLCGCTKSISKAFKRTLKPATKDLVFNTIQGIENVSTNVDKAEK